MLGGLGNASRDDKSEEDDVGAGATVLLPALRSPHRSILDSLGLSLNNGRDKRLFSAAFLDANPSRLDKLPRDMSEALSGGGDGGDCEEGEDFDEAFGAGASSILVRFEENNSRKDCTVPFLISRRGRRSSGVGMVSE